MRSKQSAIQILLNQLSLLAIHAFFSPMTSVRFELFWKTLKSLALLTPLVHHNIIIQSDSSAAP